MSIKNNTTELQEVLEALANKASGGQATPVISVNSSNGLITATAGTKSSTHQLAFQPAKTITPSTASQIAVSSGYYTGGDITVASVPTQSKSVTPTSSAQNITPDSGKFLSQVTVNAIPNTYVQPTTTKAATTYTPTTTNQTIASGTYLTGAQTIKGDANLVASNIKSGVSIFGVNGTLVEGSGSSSGEEVDWSANEDAILNRTISSYFNDRITTIGSYAFACCQNLTSVSFPAVTTIYMNAFSRCSDLISANFPVATTIGSYAFQYCSKLTTISFPVATTIGNDAFDSCSKLTTVSFPVVTTIGIAAFASCSKLTTVSFPVVTTIGGYAFEYCSKLTTVSFPAATVISSNAFSHCYNLKSLYLTGSSLCTLSNSNAFTSTPIGGYSVSAGCYGSIYVPDSLLASYKKATNWTYFSSRFVAYNPDYSEGFEEWE